MRLTLLLALGCALPLAACSQPPKTTAPTSEPMAAGDDSAARCNADALNGLVGQTASEAVVKKAVQDSGARHARVLKPGMAMTMDFREDRLSLEVDAQNKIVRANCG
ncbi:hypothetical protein KQ945_10240 [Bacillus subtilis subsp. subtilis]|nr:hypothetical protein [Bacillus subtilis subsp. subtilis]